MTRTFLHTTLFEVILPALLELAATGRIPTTEFRNDTVAADVLRRLCDLADDPPEGKNHVEHYISEFGRIDADAILGPQTTGLLANLTGKFGERLKTGYADLITIHKTVELLCENFARVLQPEIAKRSAPSQRTVLNWTPLYFAKSESEIVASVHTQFADTSRLPKLDYVVRLLDSLIIDINTTSRQIDSDTGPKMDYATRKSLRDAVAFAAAPELARFQQVDSALVDNELLEATYNGVVSSDSTMFMAQMAKNATTSPNQTMHLVSTTLTALPVTHIVLKALDTVLVKAGDSIQGTAPIVAAAALRRRLIDILAYFSLYARRVLFVDTLVYPSGSLDKRRYEEFIANGGTDELLEYYLSSHNINLFASKAGLGYSDIIERIAELKQRMLASANEEERLMRQQLVERKCKVFAAIMRDYVVPPEKYASTSSTVLGDLYAKYHAMAMEHFRHDPDVPEDVLFYEALFGLQMWKDSCARSIYMAMGRRYASTLGSVSEIDKRELSQIALIVATDMVVSMTNPIVRIVEDEVAEHKLE